MNVMKKRANNEHTKFHSNMLIFARAIVKNWLS